MRHIKTLILLTILLTTTISINESKINAVCQIDSDCDPPFLICSPKNQTCDRKPLFPLTISEIIGTITIAVLGSIAAAAGLGGGVIVIPIVLLLFGLSVKQAAAMSNVVILVNSTAKFITAIGKKDPLKPTKTLIDYHFVLMFNPVFVFSNVVGSILNKILPSGYILFMLIVMIVGVIIVNVRNGIKMYREENVALEKTALLKENLLEDEKGRTIELRDTKQRNSQFIDNNAPLSVHNRQLLGSNRSLQPIDPTQLNSTTPLNVLPHIRMQQFNDPEFKRIKKYESRDFDPLKFAYFMSTVLVIIFFSILRGSNEVESIVGITYCGNTFWFTLIVMICIVMVIAVYSIKFALREIEVNRANNNLMPHELNYNVKTIITLNIFLFVFGVIANILGLGGGMFIYPIFTSLGMQPLVVSYTAMFMLFLSKIVAVMLNYIADLIVVDLAIYFIIIATLSALLVIQKVNQIINVYKRQSVITALMVFILLISAVISPLYAYLEGSKSPKFWTFKSYC